MSDFVQQQNSVCDFDSSDSWVVLSPIEQSIKKKIEAVGTPLRDWNINIYRGVLTGCNEAFIINTEKRDEILANCQTDDERTRTAELIRPFLYSKSSTEMVIFNGLFQTVRLSKWFIYFDTPSPHQFYLLVLLLFYKSILIKVIPICNLFRSIGFQK